MVTVDRKLGGEPMKKFAFSCRYLVVVRGTRAQLRGKQSKAALNALYATYVSVEMAVREVGMVPVRLLSYKDRPTRPAKLLMELGSVPTMLFAFRLRNLAHVIAAVRTRDRSSWEEN